MTEIETLEAAKPPPHDTDVLLYDYSKYLLTLSLLIIGGVLSLAQGPQGSELPVASIIIIVAFLATSGALSLSVANQIVQARLTRDPLPRRSWQFTRAAMGALGAGVGAFLVSWMEMLT